MKETIAPYPKASCNVPKQATDEPICQSRISQYLGAEGSPSSATTSALLSSGATEGYQRDGERTT